MHTLEDMGMWDPKIYLKSMSEFQAVRESHCIHCLEAVLFTCDFSVIFNLVYIPTIWCIMSFYDWENFSLLSEKINIYPVHDSISFFKICHLTLKTCISEFPQKMHTVVLSYLSNSLLEPRNIHGFGRGIYFQPYCLTSNLFSFVKFLSISNPGN